MPCLCTYIWDVVLIGHRVNLVTGVDMSVIFQQQRREREQRKQQEKEQQRRRDDLRREEERRMAEREQVSTRICKSV